jgi:hypothetical protein
MPYVKASKDGILALAVCSLSHLKQLFGKIGVLRPRLEALPVFEFHEDAVESFHMALHSGFKCRL